MIHDISGWSDQRYFFDVLLQQEKRLRGESVLQIGARGGGAMEMTMSLTCAGFKTLDVLEVWPSNVEWCRRNLAVRRVIEGDVRKIDELGVGGYDLIIWWHGPEHVAKEDFATLLPKLMQRCGALVVGCPWGKWEQGSIHGNPFEEHLHHWCPTELLALGFDGVYTFNDPAKGDGPDRHNTMFAVKYKG